MSRKNDFQKLRNRFSVFLALARRELSPCQFRCLIRIQVAGDLLARRSPLPDPVSVRWSKAVEAELSELLESLENGTFSTPQLHPIVHLYRHLFLTGSFQRNSIEISPVEK